MVYLQVQLEDEVFILIVFVVGPGGRAAAHGPLVSREVVGMVLFLLLSPTRGGCGEGGGRIRPRPRLASRGAAIGLVGRGSRALVAAAVVRLGSEGSDPRGGGGPRSVLFLGQGGSRDVPFAGPALAGSAPPGGDYALVHVPGGVVVHPDEVAAVDLVSARGPAASLGGRDGELPGLVAVGGGRVVVAHHGLLVSRGDGLLGMIVGMVGGVGGVGSSQDGASSRGPTGGGVGRLTATDRRAGGPGSGLRVPTGRRSGGRGGGVLMLGQLPATSVARRGEGVADSGQLHRSRSAAVAAARG